MPARYANPSVNLVRLHLRQGLPAAADIQQQKPQRRVKLASKLQVGSYTQASMGYSKDEEAVVGVLKAYEDALNSDSTDAVMKLYAPDGVFMAQHNPSAVGTEAVRKGYSDVFSAIQLRVKFDIVEAVQTGAEWAFARTNSNGTVKIHATGGGGPESNQELFVFQKIDGDWKIARYCFCTTNPPHA